MFATKWFSQNLVFISVEDLKFYLKNEFSEFHTGAEKYFLGISEKQEYLFVCPKTKSSEEYFRSIPKIRNKEIE